jgi:hypothetical protein
LFAQSCPAIDPGHVPGFFCATNSDQNSNQNLGRTPTGVHIDMGGVGVGRQLLPLQGAGPIGSPLGRVGLGPLGQDRPVGQG